MRDAYADYEHEHDDDDDGDGDDNIMMMMMMMMMMISTMMMMIVTRQLLHYPNILFNILSESDGRCDITNIFRVS